MTLKLQCPDRHAEDNRISRRHSHTHLHLNPTIVFDHIKTKVKRKRRSSNHLTEAPAFATASPLSESNISQRSSEEQNELEAKQVLAGTRSQPNISSRKSFDQRSEDINENTTRHLPIEKVENPAIVVDQIEEEPKITDLVQCRLIPIESDADNNVKNKKSKCKLNKVAKPFLESNTQSNTKTRRQAVRRTGFQLHDEDFNQIFNDLPADEQLIVAYPCAWRKDIFMHGRMFLSVNYLCFYTCFFKWEESLCIAYKDIVSVKREKSAKVIPNAIQVRTRNRDRYLFASYVPRERIYIAIFRLWQNALLEKPLDYQQLRTIVYADQTTVDESTGDSEESLNLDNNDEDHPVNYSQSLPQMALDHAKEPSKVSVQGDEGITSSSPAEPTTYVSSCPCETHLARIYAERAFSYTVEQLFELTFAENSFTRAFYESQKFTDFAAGEWRTNNETGKRERQVTYKTLTQSILGSNIISCTAKQVIEVEKPRLLYVINSDVYNEGMKYTDAFFVATRFCMFQRDAKHSFLRVTAEVKYVKNVNAIVKTFVEKNCHSNIEDGVNNQIWRLENNQATANNSQFDRNKQRRRKRRDDEACPVEKKTDSALAGGVSSDNPAPVREKTITGKGFFFDMALFIGVSLLLLHIYLCYKLYTIDQALHASGSTV